MTEKKSLRTFIAIEIHPDNQKSLQAIQDHLKESAADVKWVQPSNIHLTLKFLGEVPVDKIPLIKNILRENLSDIGQFIFEIDHLGAFPKAETPQIIWAGMTKGQRNLQELAGRVEKGLAELGYPKEKRAFSAHVTLGRVRSSQNRTALGQKIKNFVFTESLRQNTDQIVIFQSTLTPSGPVYQTLEKLLINK